MASGHGEERCHAASVQQKGIGKGNKRPCVLCGSMFQSWTDFIMITGRLSGRCTIPRYISSDVHYRLPPLSNPMILIEFESHISRDTTPFQCKPGGFQFHAVQTTAGTNPCRLYVPLPLGDPSMLCVCTRRLRDDVCYDGWQGWQGWQSEWVTILSTMIIQEG